MIYDVLITGAGPIGLMLANLLGNKNIKTLIIEKDQNLKNTTRAIGITPPSLYILKKLGLDEKFINKGVKVKKVIVHGTKNKLGEIKFDSLKSNYPFILSLTQNYTEEFLLDNLKKYSSVKLEMGKELKSFNIDNDVINLDILDIKSNKIIKHKAKYLAGCDGSKSTIRNLLNLKFKGGRYKDTFLMGDFIDNSGFENDAHLFFTKKGSIESFPLPDGKRRWIIATKKFLEKPPKSYLEDEVLKRSGINIKSSKKISESPFGVQHYLCECYYNDKIIFSGDSAHVMSPIGGQGMNTGFADADLSSSIIDILINKKQNDGKYLLKKYEQYRKKAAKIATKRAWLSMRVGTVKGAVLSLLRNVFVYILIALLKEKIPPYFSMLTIPYSTLDKVKKKEKLLFKTN